MPGFIHRLSIERASSVSEDDYGSEDLVYAQLAEVPGLILPRLDREEPFSTQTGEAVGDHTIYLGRTDLTTADRIRDVTDDAAGPIYLILGIRDFRPGALGHLEVEAQRVIAPTIAGS